jgi:hypothetical protein
MARSSSQPDARAIRLRAGRKAGRTLYWQLGDAPSDDGPLAGVMGTPQLAQAVAAAMEALRAGG